MEAELRDAVFYHVKKEEKEPVIGTSRERPDSVKGDATIQGAQKVACGYIEEGGGSKIIGVATVERKKKKGEKTTSLQ